MKHVIVDLEMNKIESKSAARAICNMETIEIGAVMLDDEMQEIAAFKTYVKPEYNVCIDRRIRNLTGITDDMVKNAPCFREALRMFTSWCLGCGDPVTIYAWSNADYIQITKEVQLKGYELTEAELGLFDTEWSDFQQEFDKNLGFDRQVSLKMALDMAGIEFSGREHDALDDARNTAELLQVCRNEEAFNRTLNKIREVMQPVAISNTLGDLFDFSSFVCA